MTYQVIMSEDDIPLIVNDDSAILGRALTKKDGDAIVAALNRNAADAWRQKVLDAVSDAIEGCFDA